MLTGSGKGLGQDPVRAKRHIVWPAETVKRSMSGDSVWSAVRLVCRPMLRCDLLLFQCSTCPSGPSWPRRKALSAPCSMGSVELALVALAASARRYAEVRRCGAFRNTQRGGLGEHGFAPLIDIGVC